MCSSEGERRAWADWAHDLYPRDVYLQCEWMRAVAVVRSTRRGWLLEPYAHRLHLIEESA